MDFNAKYKKIRLLDAGGMAKVFLAEDRENGSKVAVKVLDNELSRNIVYKKRFLSEIKLTQQINSPFVVRIFDLHWDRDLQFYAMEFVDGISLRNLVAKYGRLSEEEAVRYACQIALGLEAMHRKGIVHRDIKPQNIMINNEKQVKIVDLGIARHTESENLTKTGVVIASIQYVAPEILKMETAIPRSDIYSLGIMIYFMIRGEVPFNSNDDFEIIKMHKKANLPHLSFFSPKLAKILNYMTNKNPNDRPKDMIEVFKLLDRLRF